MDSQSNRWGVLVLLVLVPLAPLLLQSHVLLQHDYFLSDLHHSHLPIRAYIGDEIAKGSIPLWWPDVFSGVPLWAQIESGVLWFPQWVFFGLFDPYIAYNFLICFNTLLSAVGAWILCRFLGATPLGAVLGGIVFALCGFNIGHFRNPNLHAAAAMMPWVLWAAERVFKRPNGRTWATLAAMIGLQNLAGMPQLTYYTLLVIAARWLWESGADWFEEARWPHWSHVVGFGAACGLGMGLAALILLPTWMFNQYTVRAGGLTWEQVSAGGFNHWDFIALLYPPASGDSYFLNYIGGSSSWNTYGYCGLVATMLAVYGVLKAPNRRLAGFLVVGAPIVLSMVIGTNNPLFYYIWHGLPGMDLFRRPARFLMVLNMGIAVGAAFGLDAFASRWRDKSTVVAVFVILFSVADLGYYSRAHLPLEPLTTWATPAAAVQQIQGQQKPGRMYFIEDYVRWSSIMHENRGFSQAGTAPFRALAGMPLGSAGAVHGLRSAGGYVVLTSRRVSEYWMRYPTYQQFLKRTYQPKVWREEELSGAFQSLLRRAAVDYLISAKPLGAPYVSLGDEVYSDPKAMSRSYLASYWSPQPDRHSVGRWLLSDGADFPAVPAIEGADEVGGNNRTVLPISVPVEDVSDRHLVQDVSSVGGGWLILTDAWDPGWTVEIDGEAAVVHIANGFQRAVKLETGAKQVRWFYTPPGLWLGLLVSLVSSLCLLLMAWLVPSDPSVERITNEGRHAQ